MELITSSLGACAGLFFAIVVVLRDRARTAETGYLAAGLILLAANLLEDALSAARVYEAVPWAFGWSYPGLVIIGPCFYLCALAAADPLEASPRRRWRHFGGAAGLLILLIPWAGAGELRWHIKSGIDGVKDLSGTPLRAFVGYLVASALQLGIYLFAARGPAAAIVDARKRRLMLAMLTIALVPWAVYAITLSCLALGYGIGPGALINALIVVAIYGFAAVEIALPPDPLEAVVATEKLRRKFVRSAIGEEAMARIVGKLDVAVRRDNIHIDPTLTLHKIAQAIRVSPHDLSQVLNTAEGGFHDWLAKRRINTALEMISTAGQEADLLDIAYAVGFNSKSTFYNAFKRTTGVTPAAWRAGVEKGPCSSSF